MEKIKILMDCDTGTDDAIALICAANTPEIELRAVTTVAGNADLRFTAPNTLNLMRYIGSDVKVSIGSDSPIKRILSEVREKVDKESEQIETHGDNGLETSFYPKQTAVSIILML